METHEFLDYLDRYTTTRDLAGEVAELLASRRLRSMRAAGAAVTPPTPISARIAS
jgi:hypothetical protein